MKVFICLAVLAFVAIAQATQAENTNERQGRYILVENRGLYDTYDKKLVVVGTPTYSNYIRYADTRVYSPYTYSSYLSPYYSSSYYV